MTTTTYINAITQALDEEMSRDPSIVLLGEDVGSMGGVFKTTAGLQQAAGCGCMEAVAERMQELVAGTINARLWWAVRALVQGLGSGGIEASLSVKKLFSRIDKELKRLIDEDPEACDTKAPEELLRNLLYYIGTCTTPEREVVAIKQTFALEELLGPVSGDGSGGGRAAVSSALRTATKALSDEVIPTEVGGHGLNWRPLQGTESQRILDHAVLRSRFSDLSA